MTVQVAGDWPGVFIRGDDAFALMQAIRIVASTISDDADVYTMLAKLQALSFCSLLNRSNVGAEGHIVDRMIAVALRELSAEDDR